MDEEQNKPWLHLDLDKLGDNEALRVTEEWLMSIRPHTLNVAGPRASKDPMIYEKTADILGKLIGR